MCDPLTLASAAATVGGTLLQRNAQARAQKAVNNAIAENDRKNDQLRQEAQVGVQDNAQKFTRESFDKNQQDETAKVQGTLTKALENGMIPGEYYGGAQSENTKRYTETKGAETHAASADSVKALAALRGFGQGQRVNEQGIRRAGEVVAMNQNKTAGNNAVLPLTIKAAEAKGHSALGDILTGVGAVGSMAGLAGAGGASASGLFGGQGAISRTIASGSPNFQGPMQSFGGTGLFKLA